MTVYLDLLILDNFVADFALLYLAVKTVKGKARFWRLFATAAFGTLLAVGYTIFNLYYTLPVAVAVFVKYGVAATLPVLAAKYKRKSTTFLAVGAFLAYMFALAGLLTALFADSEINGGGGALTYTIRGIPSGVLIGCVVGFVWLARKTVAKLAKRKKVNALTAECALCFRGNRVFANAFFDSGNLVTAPDGSFVAVADRALVVRLLGENLFSGNTRVIRIPVHTVNGKSMMTAFKIEHLEIYCGKQTNIIEDVMLGISPDGVRGEYDLILPFDCIREQNKV